MTYQVQPGNIFGRIGEIAGKGLAEQIPKEVERVRLAKGLEELGKQKGLTPFQQFTGLASQPGATNQIVQTGGELLRQQAYIDALKNQQAQGGPQGTQGYKPTPQEINQPVKGEIPTLADPESTAESYKNYIPPTAQQQRANAYENFNANPARYGYNYDNALSEQKDIIASNQAHQEALKGQEKTAVGKEETLKKAFDTEAERLGIIPIQKEKGLPANFDPKLYQKFEEKILNSILPKNEGGEGLTQEQAVKKYSGELLKAYENYRNLSTLSPWNPIEFNRQANAIQKNMASLGKDAQKTMEDKLIADYGISPIYAAHKAYPIGKGEMPSLKKLDVKTAPRMLGLGKPFVIPKVNNATYAQLKKEMGTEHSPLSIAYELDQRYQDPRGWLQYLDNNRDDLQGWQANELDKNLNIINLKDMWLEAWE